jgi:dTDP-4-dehydrorhamnose reductase
MTCRMSPPRPPELWGGVECTVNRVGERWRDQVRLTGHHDRLDDLDRIASLGIRTLRYPVLWERVAPDGVDRADWRWTDERLSRLRELGIRPIVGLLHHGSGPAYTSLIDDAFAVKLASFAEAVAARYPWVTDFTPVNEPLTTARFSGLYGHWYPHATDVRTFAKALWHQVSGTVEAMKAIRRITPGARLIQTEDCGVTTGTPATIEQVTHEGNRRWLTWDLLAGHVAPAHPMWRDLVAWGIEARALMSLRDDPCPPDVVGLNYYLTSDRHLDEQLERYPLWTHGGNGRVQYADVEAVRASDHGIAGHYTHLMAAWNRYRIPVAITELHLACTRDEQLRWFAEGWEGACAAQRDGADVRAVTPWALLGSYDWDSLLTQDARRYEAGVFDLRAAQPRETALALAVRACAASERLSHPVLESAGWWRRSDRLSFRAGKPPREHGVGRPLLIVGATAGALRACARACESRGLAVRLATAGDACAAIAAERPWAVVNAVRLSGEATGTGDAPVRGGTANLDASLASACHRLESAYVTFSSDLVFDGRAVQPYSESDAASPENDRGSWCLEAERRAAAACPRALVVRTGPLFGGDGDHLADRILLALLAGQRIAAPIDVTVSPSLASDVFHAALDLLIDGATGVWHVVNAGATSWWEFGRLAADMVGADPDLVEATYARDLPETAVAPRYRALTSERGWTTRPLEMALRAHLEGQEATRASGVAACA